MKVYFVRHGQTEYNTDSFITGQLDVSLSAEGIEQIRNISEAIQIDFSEIYSSDLIRCRQTTVILNEKLNLPVTYDTRLRNRHLGSFEGKSWKSFDPVLKEKDKIQQYDYRPYGGEHVEDVKKRVFSFIKEIQGNKKDKKILVITSGGIIRLLHNILNGEIREKISNSSLYELEFPDNF